VSSKSYRKQLELWEAKAAALRADDEKQPCRKPETSQQMSIDNATMDEWTRASQKARAPVELDQTLATRAETYGKFEDNAAISQELKETARHSDNWAGLENDQKESLDQIFSKIGRLLTGDPDHYDSWHDIAGYATLVAERLAGNSR
jgi:hypothetical protein